MSNFIIHVGERNDTKLKIKETNNKVNVDIDKKPEYKKYTGEYIVTPRAYNETELATKNKLMIGDVKVLKIPYFETSNEQGYTAYIADEV